ncbi:zinc finger and BTB domain-containing protein 7A-like isoform X2 [Penaeus monodon]|uniref:zinc finger and BTB domain-containing protein 7A-like isoform X2 n=1 Tax=Penaeus monodon TaxID=6687 RepID=UPI0018A75E39|nr:zinc finger and BTB domain-containing protein 7A-like isoform X2 [Penaeus monodon]
MGDGMLSLSWNNHSATFCHTLSTLRAKDRYTDVTLACEGKFYPVHKLVLSTCSEYFENMFENTPCKHPVIVLRDVRCDELEALLSYMYAGIVSVAQSDLAQLIKVAELLQIKGLAVPDEPPNSNKRPSDDDRTSPHMRTRQGQNASNDRSSPYLRTKHSQASSEDRASPLPKRRRRTDTEVSLEDSQSSSGMQSVSKTPSQACEQQDHSRLCGEIEETDNRNGTDQNDYQSSAQESLISNVQVTLEETLVKEEVLEDMPDNQADTSDPGHEFDSSTGGQDSGNLMIPKYDDQDSEGLTQSGLSQAPPLSEAVIEALAGPSGMQGWPGGGDMARRLALGEGFVDTNQDVSALTLGQAGSQAHQLVELESDMHSSSGRRLTIARMDNDDQKKKMKKCPFCPYTTTRLSHMICHKRTHSGEKPYSCHLCSFQTCRSDSLKRHLRSHGGEKLYSCQHCPLSFHSRTSLGKHLSSHIFPGPFSCPHCPHSSTSLDTLREHMALHLGPMEAFVQYTS